MQRKEKFCEKSFVIIMDPRQHRQSQLFSVLPSLDKKAYDRFLCFTGTVSPDYICLGMASINGV